MSVTTIITNNSGEDKTYAGQTVVDGESYTLQIADFLTFREDEDLMVDIASGNTIVSNATDDYDAITGWGLITGSFVSAKIEQKSDSQGEKIAAHVSSKPMIPGKAFYATWTGAGDDVSGGAQDGEIGGGDPLTFKFANGDTQLTRQARFHPMHGDFYIHDGYIKWKGAHIDDSITVRICADATTLQPYANLDLVVDAEGWVSYSTGGPGTGTHGFAATPSLIPRTFANDGDWNYSTAAGLSPNFTKTGKYKMNTSEKVVHTFVQRMPLIGDADNYMKLYSEESTLMPSSYFMDIVVDCPDGSDTLEAATIIYAYRQKTTHTP